MPLTIVLARGARYWSGFPPYKSGQSRKRSAFPLSSTAAEKCFLSAVSSRSALRPFSPLVSFAQEWSTPPGFPSVANQFSPELEGYWGCECRGTFRRPCSASRVASVALLSRADLQSILTLWERLHLMTSSPPSSNGLRRAAGSFFTSSALSSSPSGREHADQVPSVSRFYSRYARHLGYQIL